MEARARVALGVAGGYLLGRTKKMKLALTLGGMLAGRRVGAGSVLGKGLGMVATSPEFGRLRKQLGGAGRTAAVAAASNSLSRVTQRIESGPANSSDDDDSRDRNDGDERGEQRPRRKPAKAAARSSSRPRSSGTRRAAPAKQAASRTSTSRSGAKKAPARRSAAKKSAAKKSAAKSTAKKAPQRRATRSTARGRGDRRG